MQFLPTVYSIKENCFVILIFFIISDFYASFWLHKNCVALMPLNTHWLYFFICLFSYDWSHECSFQFPAFLKAVLLISRRQKIAKPFKTDSTSVLLFLENQHQPFGFIFYFFLLFLFCFDFYLMIEVMTVHSTFWLSISKVNWIEIHGQEWNAEMTRLKHSRPETSTK